MKYRATTRCKGVILESGPTCTLRSLYISARRECCAMQWERLGKVAKQRTFVFDNDKRKRIVAVVSSASMQRAHFCLHPAFTRTQRKNGEVLFTQCGDVKRAKSGWLITLRTRHNSESVPKIQCWKALKNFYSPLARCLRKGKAQAAVGIVSADNGAWVIDRELNWNRPGRQNRCLGIR